MRLRIYRSDGKTGTYSQEDRARAELLIKRLDPAKIFVSGPIVIGVLNPFSVINPDEVCWVEIESDLDTIKTFPPEVDNVRKMVGREEYEALLSKQWPQWIKFKKGIKGDLLEAAIELSMRNGQSLYLHVTGKVGNANIVEDIFGVPALYASFPPNGTLYINPRCIVRARVYHSKDRVNVANGFWFAEADDV